ncbi:hypothetical protein FGB62_124g026 [Gracilaria domingensis]|nr:hypothetical protein FGB62_124g026 [Gracilaria domingensis]
MHSDSTARRSHVGVQHSRQQQSRSPHVSSPAATSPKRRMLRAAPPAAGGAHEAQLSGGPVGNGGCLTGRLSPTQRTSAARGRHGARQSRAGRLARPSHSTMQPRDRLHRATGSAGANLLRSWRATGNDRALRWPGAAAVCGRKSLARYERRATRSAQAGDVGAAARR